MESGEERVRQESSVVKDKTSCCKKWVPRGEPGYHRHPEELDLCLTRASK